MAKAGVAGVAALGLLISGQSLAAQQYTSVPTQQQAPQGQAVQQWVNQQQAYQQKAGSTGLPTRAMSGPEHVAQLRKAVENGYKPNQPPKQQYYVPPVHVEPPAMQGSSSSRTMNLSDQTLQQASYTSAPQMPPAQQTGQNPTSRDRMAALQNSMSHRAPNTLPQRGTLPTRPPANRTAQASPTTSMNQGAMNPSRDRMTAVSPSALKSPSQMGFKPKYGAMQGFANAQLSNKSLLTTGPGLQDRIASILAKKKFDNSHQYIETVVEDSPQMQLSQKPRRVKRSVPTLTEQYDIGHSVLVETPVNDRAQVRQRRRRDIERFEQVNNQERAQFAQEHLEPERNQVPEVMHTVLAQEEPVQDPFGDRTVAITGIPDSEFAEMEAPRNEVRRQVRQQRPRVEQKRSSVQQTPRNIPRRQALLDENGRPISVLENDDSNYGMQLPSTQTIPQYRPARSPNRRLYNDPYQEDDGRPTQDGSDDGQFNQIDESDQSTESGSFNQQLPEDQGMDQDFSSDLRSNGEEENDPYDGLEELDTPDVEDELDDEEEPTRRSIDKSCEEFRSELLSNNPITKISLDISPPKSKLQNDMMVISRSWSDRHGNMIANGTLVDLRRGYAIIDSGGGRQKIAFARLGDADLAAIAEFWSLPTECTVGNDGFDGRNWTPQTVTWKASSLCHKPLFFENIQLERYGHSHGPFMQPVHSVAHLFTSLVTLPYQTSIHPPNECLYALGFYRPGNCAPWLKDPVPISLDGFKRQAEFTTGFAFIP